MIDISKVKQRKNFLLCNEYHSPKQNLYILEQSAKKGNMSSLEKYINEWNSYSTEELISLNKVLDIISEFLQKSDNQDYIKKKVNYLIENNIIPRLTKKDSILYINDFALDIGLPCLDLLRKCNEVFTYDRILKNQSIIENNLEFDWDNDTDDIVVNICELFYNSHSLTREEQYALSLENSLLTMDIVSKQKYFPKSTEDIIDLVDIYYGFVYNESFDYDEINPINEEKEVNAFPYTGVSGLMSGVYLNTGVSLEQMISRIPRGELKKYEKSNGLKPLEFVDFESSKAISAYVTNEYSESDRSEFVRKKIDGNNYNCIVFYEDSSVSKFSILYKKGNDLVAVPIYSRFGDCQPTIVHNGITKTVHEMVDEIIYLNEKKNIKKKPKKDIKKSVVKTTKKGGESLKKALSKINLKDTKGAKEIEKLLTKFFSKNPDNVLDEVPGVFATIRTCCLITAMSINPYLGIVTYITNKFLSIHYERKRKEKVIKMYEDEIKTVERKLDKCKNEKTKQKYKDYLKKLEDDKRKLETHYEKYFTDDEIYGSDNDDDDDDFTLESSNLEVFNELSVASNLRLVQQKFKKGIIKMSDKEKKLSSQMDNAFDRFIYQVEKNMSNKNREAVIKGSVIPSFSALIKLALVAGTAAFISPVLSAITVLGGFAASKRATANERKYILDEIDIQLKVVKKKLDLAESNNDMRAYEELLKIERQLESEKNRIVYKRKRSVVATKYN